MHAYLKNLTACFILVAVSTNGISQTAPATTEVKDRSENQSGDSKSGSSGGGESAQFVGLKFGLGVGLTFDTGTRDRVDNASIDSNGIVRIDKKSNISARVLLETHYLFERNLSHTYAVGPFLALQPGTNQVIDSIGGGFMWAWRHSKNDVKSFNLGLGYLVDPATKVLGDEFKENRSAPVDAAGKPMPLRYVTKEKGSLLLMASFSW